jgi:hypothetical protein
VHCVSDALIVCRNDDRVDGSAFSGTAVDVFDHRPPGNHGQGLPGKTRRCVAGRDDNDAAGESGAGGLVGRNGDGHVES